MYSISLPRAGYFLVVPSEGCRGNTVDPDRAQEKSKGGKGTGQLWCVTGERREPPSSRILAENTMVRLPNLVPSQAVGLNTMKIISYKVILK